MSGKRVIWLILLTLLSALLILSRLGTYALWDDEAGTALHGEAVFKTGDTGAIIGDNLLAFRGGVALQGLKDRTVSPLQYYVTAPFVGMFSKSSFAARLPFALCGVFLMGFLYWWILISVKKDWYAAVLVVGFLSNVSLILYLRQCRYYSLAILFTGLIFYIYCKWGKNKERPYLLSSLSAMLMASNYLVFVAVWFAIGVDYVVWRRRETMLSLRSLIIFSGTQILAAIILLSIWNPLRSPWGSYIHERALSWSEKLVLFTWNLRELSVIEVLPIVVLIAALYVITRMRDVLITRGILGILSFTFITTLFSPQTGIHSTGVADIRYMAPVIPLGIFITCRTIFILFNKKIIMMCLACSIAFFSNALCGVFILQGELRSTFIQYVEELIQPPSDPYSPTADWIRAHVPKGASIWVLPDYMTYPLMFHAPDSIYAWQLNPEQKKDPQFKDLPDIHFKGVVLPDYIIIFGPMIVQIREMLQQWKQQGADYQEIYRINTFWKDLYRPELFWRTFKPIAGFDPDTQAIYIYKHVSPAGDLQKSHP